MALRASGWLLTEGAIVPLLSRKHHRLLGFVMFVWRVFGARTASLVSRGLLAAFASSSVPLLLVADPLHSAEKKTKEGDLSFTRQSFEPQISPGRVASLRSFELGQGFLLGLLVDPRVLHDAGFEEFKAPGPTRTKASAHGWGVGKRHCPPAKGATSPRAPVSHLEACLDEACSSATTWPK